MVESHKTWNFGTISSSFTRIEYWNQTIQCSNLRSLFARWQVYSLESPKRFVRPKSSKWIKVFSWTWTVKYFALYFQSNHIDEWYHSWTLSNDFAAILHLHFCFSVDAADPLQNVVDQSAQEDLSKVMLNFHFSFVKLNFSNFWSAKLETDKSNYLAIVWYFHAKFFSGIQHRRNDWKETKNRSVVFRHHSLTDFEVVCIMNTFVSAY